jgi:hypothetical protein
LGPPVLSQVCRAQHLASQFTIAVVALASLSGAAIGSRELPMEMSP